MPGHSLTILGAADLEDARYVRGVWAALFDSLDPTDQRWVLDCLDRYREVLSSPRL